MINLNKSNMISDSNVVAPEKKKGKLERGSLKMRDMICVLD